MIRTGSCAERRVERPPIDLAAPAVTETATFALGWFWTPEASFALVPGVVRTRVGYAGGTTVDPTYHNIGDHTETLQLDYDPSQTCYERLLEVFWQAHDPTQRAWSRQYMAAVFPHNDAQERMAVETRDRLPAARQGSISTQVVPGSRFYLAEGYHQKYYLRQAPELMRVFEATYPRTEDFVASTAAGRVNAYLSGAGTAEALAAELDSLGLTGSAAETLRRIVRRGR